MKKERVAAFEKAGLILLTLWAMVVIVPDLGRVFGNYGTLGFEADNNGRVSRVFGPPAASPDADIRENDRIDLKGTPLADRLAVFGGMGGIQYLPVGHEVHLCMEREGGGPRPERKLVILKAVPKPLSSAGRLVLFFDTAGGILFILLAFALVWQRPNAMTWGFFLYAMWFNPGQFFAWYAELQRWPYGLLGQEAAQALAQGLGYAGFVAFALRFPHNTVPSRWQSVGRVLPFLAGLLVVLQLLGFATALGFPAEGFGQAFYLTGYAIDLFVLFILRVKRESQAPEDRQRTRWVEWGCWVGLLAFIVADSNEATDLWGYLWRRLSWYPSETTLSALYLVNAAVPLAIFHAIRKHRVVDVRFACSRATTLLLTWLGIGISLAAASVYVEGKIPFHDRVLFFIAVVALMKLFLERLHEWLNKGADRLFFSPLVRAEEEMRRLAASLAAGVECESVDARLAAEPASCLRLASAAVFRRDRDGAYWQQPGAIGWEDRGGRQGPALPATLVRKVESSGMPLRLALDDLHGEMPGGTRLPILAVPSAGRDGLLAIALYGAHETGTDLTDDEVAILGEFGQAAVSGYECARMRMQSGQIEALEGELRQCRGSSGQEEGDLC